MDEGKDGGKNHPEPGIRRGTTNERELTRKAETRRGGAHAKMRSREECAKGSENLARQECNDASGHHRRLWPMQREASLGHY